MDDSPGERGERFRRADRLRSQREFDRVYARKHRAGDDVLLVYAAVNDLPHARLGLSVSKRVGNAVRRNLWKRLVREAFRRNRGEIPASLDLIVIPRGGVDPSLAAIRDSLIRLSRRLARKLRPE